MIVCEELFNMMTEMVVDEENRFAVESCNKVGNKVKITKTDHNMLIGRFNLKVLQKIVSSRREIFKYSDVEGQQRFKELTSKETLSKCFQNKDIVKESEKWLKELKNILHRSFKKVRVGNVMKENPIVEKMKLKHKLKVELETIENEAKGNNVSSKDIKKKHKLEDKIEEVEAELAEATAEKHSAIISEHFDNLTDNDGDFSVIKMWSLKKKLFPQGTEVPMAMQDKGGNLISGKMGLKRLYKTTYEDRLSHKPIKAGWEDIQILKENLFEYRMKLCSAKKSKNWDVLKVKKICKKLKSGKARDRDDLTYDLFKPDLAGDDLMMSLTHMFNGIKSNLLVPDFFQKVSITSLYKLRGQKSDFANQRGVFNLSKVRSILDKILYDDVYDHIDDKLSCSNIGGRKGRNIRDHLFTVYAIINDVINGCSPAIDIQGIDIYKCFDEMWFAETHNDLFDVSIQDDKFALIAKMDEEANVVVKTPCGLTDEFQLDKLVMQGSVFGPIKSTIQIDTLGRDCESYNQGLFKYKNVLSTVPLALIDDCLGISLCGTDAVEMNAILNTKIDAKKLRLSTDKCTHMHISKTSSKCYSNLKADNVVMKKTTECKYLGDILSSSGSMDPTIENRRQKGVGLVSEISGMINGLSLGYHFFRISFLLRESRLVNGIMTNAEIWHPLSDNQMDVLENIDLMLIRKIVKGHSKAPKETFFMDTGLLPLKYVTIKRRLLFLQTILKRSKSELTRNVYEVQKMIPAKHDWSQLVMQNKKDLNIQYLDEEIQAMSTDKFKLIVTKSVEKEAMNYLNSLALKHDKSKALIKQKLCIEKYFLDPNFSKSDVELLFAFRTSMVRDIKNNFPQMYKNNIACDICKVHVCSQQHLLQCTELRKHVNVPDDIEYGDLFKNTEKQLKIIKIMKKLLRAREIIKCK